MKQQISPAVVGIVVVIILVVVGFVMFKGTGGGGSKAPGEPANSSPFAPGGDAIKDGGGAKTVNPNAKR